MKKLTLNDLTIDSIKESVKNRSCMVFNVDEFIKAGLFSEDFPDEEELNKLNTRERNKKVNQMMQMAEEGFTLDLQTLNIMSLCYDAIKPENQDKVEKKILKDPILLVDFIDRCWDSVKR